MIHFLDLHSAWEWVCILQDSLIAGVFQWGIICGHHQSMAHISMTTLGIIPHSIAIAITVHT